MNLEQKPSQQPCNTQIEVGKSHTLVVTQGQLSDSQLVPVADPPSCRRARPCCAAGRARTRRWQKPCVPSCCWRTAPHGRPWLISCWPGKWPSSSCSTSHTTVSATGQGRGEPSLHLVLPPEQGWVIAMNLMVIGTLQNNPKIHSSRGVSPSLAVMGKQVGHEAECFALPGRDHRP